MRLGGWPWFCVCEVGCWGKRLSARSGVQILEQFCSCRVWHGKLTVTVGLEFLFGGSVGALHVVQCGAIAGSMPGLQLWARAVSQGAAGDSVLSRRRPVEQASIVWLVDASRLPGTGGVIPFTMGGCCPICTTPDAGLSCFTNLRCVCSGRLWEVLQPLQLLL